MAQAKRFDPVERLDRAVDVFWRDGFDGVGMQDLCREMELFPGSLYGTYGDKRALFLQSVDRYMATCSTEAMATLARNPSGLAAIREYFAELVEGMLAGRRRWGCLVTNSIVELAQRDPEIRERTDRHLERLQTAFADAIARGKAGGAIPDNIPADRAGFLVAIVQGMNVLAKTSPNRETLEAIVRGALEALR